MRTKPVLVTAQADFDGLHAALDRATKSETVKVPKEALRRVLQDHSTFFALYKMEN